MRECILRKGELYEPDKIIIDGGNCFFVAVRLDVYGRRSNAQGGQISNHRRYSREPAL